MLDLKLDSGYIPPVIDTFEEEKSGVSVEPEVTEEKQETEPENETVIIEIAEEEKPNPIP